MQYLTGATSNITVSGAAPPVQPLAPVIRSAEWIDYRDPTPWGPAARLDLTDLGDAILRSEYQRMTFTGERVAEVRSLFARRGPSPSSIALAVAILRR